MNHQKRIQQAFRDRTPLYIRGGDSKSFLTSATNGKNMLRTGPLDGVLDYQPEELFIRARAGTPLRDIEALLLEQRQMLAFEPPHFSPRATLGGAIATGLSGPSRPWRGAARDFILGCVLINGRGERLRFGGEVIKNVAGYDVSRLQCGAFGTLGLLEEISIKTLPMPEEEVCLTMELNQAEALEKLRQWNRLPLPLTGAAWYQGRLHIRLGGNSSAVTGARRALGGEEESDAEFWLKLKEQQLDFFDADLPLWRLSLPRDRGPLELPGDMLLDWGGAQRWLLSDRPYEQLSALAAEAGGHVAAWHTHAPHPLPPGLMRLHRRLKQAFDPAGILNPGQLVPGI